MKRIRMLKTKNLTRGTARYRYDVGKVFYLPFTVANKFIEEGSAMEDKSMDMAPETKKRGRTKKVQTK